MDVAVAVIAALQWSKWHRAVKQVGCRCTHLLGSKCRAKAVSCDCACHPTSQPSQVEPKQEESDR